MDELDKIKIELSRLVEKAYSKNEIPVAALLTKDEKIVSKAYNKRKRNGDPLGHAEIICILKATKKQKYWRLNEYKLYVTLEPCEMCKRIIEECGISEVHYFLSSKNIKKSCNTCYIQEKSDNIYFEEKMHTFFEKIRKE